MEYNFAYDAQNRPATVKVGSQTLSETVYNTAAGDPLYGTVTGVNFGNGGRERNTYDDYKRLTGVRFDGDTEDRYRYAYGANGQVAKVTDNLLGRTAVSEYDVASRPMRIIHMEGDDHLYTGQVWYDEYSNLQTFKEQVGTSRTAYQTDFTYDTENKPTLMTFGDTENKVAYAYNAIGRMSGRTVTVGGTAYATAYGYLAGCNGSGSTTPLIASMSQSGETCAYTYDDVGNILTATRNGVTASYVYDNLGQLIRVNDPDDTTSGSAGTTWVYDYDRGGNILTKKRYAYATGGVGDVLQTISYTYGDSNWKDKLTAYDGTAITYDAIGNPLTDGTWTYTWEKGRQLKLMTNGTTTAAFAYNANGLRVRKTVNGVVTNYTLHGKNIVHMTHGSNDLHFFYDAQNRPAIVAYNGTKYAYIYNLQGDVLGLIDSNGTEVVKYTYDAWGKALSTTGSLASSLGIVQPFRYRGYVYDVEIGLYYLRSRYYNPGWQRFVNADTLIKGNLYTYCKNNSLLWRDNLGTDEVKSESTGDITNFIREGFRCTVFVENPTFPTNSGYMQTITAVFYIPYQDIQYYNNALYFETKNPIDVAIESAVWKIESKANDMIIDTIGKYLWSKAHYFGYLMDAIGVAEDYINAAAEAALKEQHQVAQQKATDNQSGMIVKMTYMRRWFYVYSIAGSRMGTYWEADPIISYQYYESSDPSISNYYSLLMQ